MVDKVYNNRNFYEDKMLYICSEQYGSHKPLVILALEVWLVQLRN